MDCKSSVARVLVTLGCTRNVLGPGDGTGSGSGTGPGATGSNANGSAGSTGSVGLPGEFVPSGSRLRRLTVIEYQNSLRDLLGPAIVIPTELEADTVLNGFAAIG